MNRFRTVKRSVPNDSIHIPKDANPYNYRININHPKIRPLYENWKQERHITIPSDAERHHFEIYIQLLIDHGELKEK